jgi:hypothetical protein
VIRGKGNKELEKLLSIYDPSTTMIDCLVNHCSLGSILPASLQRSLLPSFAAYAAHAGQSDALQVIVASKHQP